MRRLLAESGLDGSSIPPTGPKRTLTKGDVLAAMGLCAPPSRPSRVAVGDDASSTPAARDSPALAPATSSPGETTEDAFEDAPVTPMRRAIATRLCASKSNAPHHYVEAEVGLAATAALRERLRRDAPGARKPPSVNDCVLYAVSRALRRCPEVNATWNERRGVSERLDAIDVAVAVATPGGLLTPVVRDADAKSLSQIGAEVRALARRAREGTLDPEECVGGSFTVSNLGMFPVDAFCAILNPPQGAIMAVGRGRDAVGVDARDATKLVASPGLSATVSADARAADAADVARFLEAFKDVLENPEGGEGKEKWAL